MAQLTAEDAVTLHKQRHKELHTMLDELVADMIAKTGKRPSQTTVLELIEWSYSQTQNPD